MSFRFSHLLKKEKKREQEQERQQEKEAPNVVDLDEIQVCPSTSAERYDVVNLDEIDVCPSTSAERYDVVNLDEIDVCPSTSAERHDVVNPNEIHVCPSASGERRDVVDLDEIRVCSSPSAERLDVQRQNERTESSMNVLQMLAPMMAPFQTAEFNNRSKRRGFLMLFFVLCFMHGLVVGYIDGIRKHLYRGNEITKYLNGLDDILCGLLALVISYYGNRYNKMRILGGAIVLQSVYGMVMGAFDTMSRSVFLTNNHTEVTCGEAFVDVEDKNAIVVRINVMIFSAFLSVTSISFGTLSISYLDDHFKYFKSPYYIGIYYGLIATGGFLGLVFSRLPLMFQPVTFFSSPLWVIVSCLFLLCGTMTCMFPKELPPAYDFTGMFEGLYLEPKPPLHSLTLKMIIEKLWENKFLFLTVPAVTFMNIAIVNFDIFKNDFYKAKYFIAAQLLQRKSKETRRLARINFYEQPISTVCAVATGFLIMKFQPNYKILAILNTIIILSVMAFFAVESAINCKSSVNFKLDINLTCSENCGCPDNLEFSPVCLEKQNTYYSPCHAGCTYKKFDEINKAVVYYNCSCGNDTTVATPGPCYDKCETYLEYSETIRGMISGLNAMSQVVRILLYVRSVPKNYKAVALSIDMTLTHLLPYIPFRFITESMIGNVCELWQNTEECAFQGNFDVSVTAVTVSYIFVAALLSTIAVFFVEDIWLYGYSSKCEFITGGLTRGKLTIDSDASDYINPNIRYDSNSSGEESS